MHDLNFEQWFTVCFVKEVESYEKPVVLLFNGHNSHLTYQTVKCAMDNKIVLVCLPMKHEIIDSKIAEKASKNAWSSEGAEDSDD